MIGSQVLLFYFICYNIAAVNVSQLMILNQLGLQIMLLSILLPILSMMIVRFFRGILKVEEMSSSNEQRKVIDTQNYYVGDLSLRNQIVQRTTILLSVSFFYITIKLKTPLIFVPRSGCNNYFVLYTMQINL